MKMEVRCEMYLLREGLHLKLHEGLHLHEGLLLLFCVPICVLDIDNI